MELGSKSKRSYKLKSSKQNRNELHNNWFDSTDDGEDDDKTGASCQMDVAKTSVRSFRPNKPSPIPQNLSPQFRVGWNDGSHKNICDMGSPVSAIPASRKIRRCPENLLSKISPPVIEPDKTKNNEGSSCEILQCINWAKSLIESTNFQPPDEGEPKIHDSISEITESIQDTSIDIPLDDSSNELMIMCSQAIEESVSAGKFTLKNENTESEKHHITPNRNNNPSKRFKPQLDSNNVFPKGNISNFDRRLNNCDQKLNKASSTNNLTKESGLLSENVSVKNVLNVDNIFKRPNQSSVNNNSANLKNFNKSTNSMILDRSDDSVRENKMISPLMTITPSVSDKSLSASSHDDIKSHLDDEDDLFCSLDFNFLDSLQKKPIVSSKPEAKSSINVVKPQMNNRVSSKVDTKPSVTKYTKQEIEKRRLEARKRLLFNKKHRSM